MHADDLQPILDELNKLRMLERANQTANCMRKLTSWTGYRQM